MPKYDIELCVTFCVTVEGVEADSLVDAIDKAKNLVADSPMDCFENVAIESVNYMQEIK